jgi:radical SAM protein with 4Fe4S-binding SPASM domain
MPVTYGCSHFLGLDLERELRGWYFFCGAGIHVASIMCNGDIGACLDIERRPETIQGNIFRDSFTDVWKNRFKIFRRPMSDFNEKCRVCPEAKWCAGDSRHSWDYEKMEPMLCFRDVFF